MFRRLGHVLAPLVAGRTWRGWAHLILGGALLVPFWIVALVLVGSMTPNEGAGALIVPIAAIVGVLPVVWLVGFLMPQFRSLELVAARDLLDAPVEDVEGDARSVAARQRTGTWVALHLGLGGLVSGLSLGVPPGVAYLLAWPITHRPDDGDLPGWLADSWAPAVGLALLVGLVYLVAGLGTILRRVAPRLLGPTPADRMAALERQAERLAERNRLARELHDSVGHALSIITVQAGAAQRVQRTDPAFVGGALGAIEEAARGALEDLDHVLGVLRADAEASLRPQPTLADLDRLVAGAQAAGVDVDAKVAGPLGGVPPVVSREAYRIVQEGLTNAVRHAGAVPVTLRVSVTPDALELDVANPTLSSPSSPSSLASAVVAGGRRGRAGAARGGRGLRGIRERVTVLRGEMTAGPEGGRWRLAVSLPLRSPP